MSSTRISHIYLYEWMTLSSVFQMDTPENRLTITYTKYVSQWQGPLRFLLFYIYAFVPVVLVSLNPWTKLDLDIAEADIYGMTCHVIQLSSTVCSLTFTNISDSEWTCLYGLIKWSQGVTWLNINLETRM